jgi:hypothetical protein
MNGFKRFAYRTIFRKTSTWVMAGIVGAIILENTGSSLVDRFWFWVNKGKLWPDVHKRLQELKAQKESEGS